MTHFENFTEDSLEKAVIETLQEMDYEYAFGPDLSVDGPRPERNDFREVVLDGRLRDALFKLNRDLPADAIEDVYRRVITFNSPSLIENNRHFHKLLTEGVDVSFHKNGGIKTEKAIIIDFEHPERNDFLVVNQFTIIENENRRPDVLIFVNGLPLVVIELKSTTDENVGIEQAYNQIQTYKQDIPSLFYYNAFCILSDGINAKTGTITSNEERFMNWRSVDGVNVASLDVPQYEVMIHGMLEKSRFLDIIQNFILFQESKETEYDAAGNKIGDKKTIIKIMAAYHQYFAVKKAVENTKIATSTKGDRKIGVVWHTQGSGKSFTMVFYTAYLVKELNNPTIVVITDRNDLDDQLYSTFAKSVDILRQTPKQADVRRFTEEQKKQQAKSNAKELNGLYDLLNERESGGIIFTTIQKFQPEEGEMPVLTDRRNVIIIADEAHRSQYGFEAKTNSKTGDLKYGYAKYLRDAFPNASFIGFTGTPIEFDDKSTPAVFGDYIDIYDMTRAVEDEATVKIYYENRVIKVETDDEELKKIDDEFEEITEGQEETVREKYKTKWSRLETVVGSPNRIKQLAKDIVEHFEEKQKTIDGKAMIVCMSRRICVDLYDEIIKLRPSWHNDDVNKGVIKVVMTGSAADEERLQEHIGGKQRRDTLAKRMKDPNDELKLVIVRDMWLTGFDVPSMHTMYIDKPMKGHTLMQAIARVNRVFKDKPGGVVVDYIGILESLKKALKQYTDSDKENTGIDTSAAVQVMQEKLEILRAMFHGFDYSDFMGNSQKDRMRAITGGMNFVLGLPEKEQKEFKQFALEAAKAHALCAATEEGKAAALEVSYFKAVKASLAKLGERKVQKNSKKEIETRVNQMLQRSILSEDVIDVFDALGLERPENVSLLSEEFLQEVRGLKYKNLAVEMLKKLLEGNLKVMEKRNLVKSEKFSEKLKKAINKYRNQAITNAEVIEELIKMAKEFKKAREEEKDLGLNEDEIAFYDALTADNIVKQFMDDETLKKIAQELTNAIKQNITIDWSVRKSAQAGMRRIIKRLLKKYDYPPKQAKTALEIVMKQAELMAGHTDPREIDLELGNVAETSPDYK
ncbi:type I restriction endonuclease subunit R [Caldibacillus sp. 210928-DFI.2.22]|uniref:type I restriction endonuclease subunit R n=1 Tax=unclassified Caldibacillus TaxID=2641266 RepID=UPI001D07F4CF|nr:MULTISPECIES: type I restriction endonuclease subunit R [unclassified Caldibacillus]MCB7069788.1 type I restriction endonuclease subunit R [Caldibacillus sp. 210928-DFI.2.22]MCB7073255.1 type I restriction endonuclease subunit R [Caldibacillus sp. 210928-DFI.2.18]